MFKRVFESMSSLPIRLFFLSVCCLLWSTELFAVARQNKEIDIQEKHEYSHLKKLEKLPDNMEVDKLLSLLPNDRFLGNKNARVVVIEYASFLCSHCAEFHLKVFPTIEREYIQTGKILFIFRNFPLDRRSLQAAMLGFCYQRNIDFFTYAKAVFSSIASWTLKADDLGVLENIAKISNKNLDKCIRNDAAMNYVIQEKLLGHKKLGITGTPVLFIGKEKYEGLQTEEFIKAKIDEAIANNPNYSTSPMTLSQEN